MQQLASEGVSREITDIWNQLGPEGEGEELKLAAHHCLLGVQECLSRPDEYNLLDHYELTHRNDPQHKDFLSFKNEIETGNYQIHFSLDTSRNKEGGRSVHLSTWVERRDHHEIPLAIRSNMEKWASTIGYDALVDDIHRILKLLEHAQPLDSHMFKSAKTAPKSSKERPGAKR